jgi:hypothetical protein
MHSGDPCVFGFIFSGYLLDRDVICDGAEANTKGSNYLDHPVW